MDLHLLPLVDLNGVPTIGRDKLVWIHGQLMRLHGRASFQDGDLDDVENWVTVATSKHTSFFVLHHIEQPVMVIWINDHRKTRATGHWFWLRSRLNWEGKVKASRWALREIFKILPYPVIIGQTPADNTRAIKFMLDVGLHIVGNIPNALYSRAKGCPVDATMLYLQREDLEENESL